MGMQVRLVLYARDETAARGAANAAFAEIDRLDGILSDYRRGSELVRLVHTSADSPVLTSNDLGFVLDRALRLAEQTHGAFDPTAGPLTLLWRTAIQTGQLPTDDTIAEAADRVGWNKVIRIGEVRNGFRLTQPGMQLDLGAIAKGFTLDQAIAMLASRGARSAMAEAGGDIVTGRAPPDRSGWHVTLPHPGECTINVAGAAVSTSGDSEQFVEVDGVRHSHTIDPRTGYGVTNRRLVTVVADDGITADGLATALTVLEPAAGRELLLAYADAAAFVSSARPSDEQSEVWGQRSVGCITFDLDGEAGGF